MILLVDDHPLVRQGLESILRMYDHDEQMIQAGTVREAIRLIGKHDITKAFVDLNLKQESGFRLIEWIREHDLSIKIFLITTSSRGEDFIYAKELGVDAYILKDAFVDDIVYGMKVVERGDKFYSANIMEQMQEISEKEKLFRELTTREREVLKLVGNGYSNQKISQELYISEGTTKKHISSILSKLGVENRVRASLLIRNNIWPDQAGIGGGKEG